MCGVFGAVGSDKTTTRFLTLLNEERGRDSLGLYCNGEILRFATDPIKVLETQAVMPRAWSAEVVLGHTRQATHGKVTVANCHPFVIGNIVGAHNGVIQNFDALQKEYETHFEVDSQIIFYLLDQKGTEGLTELDGFASVWWLDKRDPQHFYLWNWDNDLHYAKHRGAFLFSSSKRHLQMIGCRRVIRVHEGELLTISVAQRRVVERAQVDARSSWLDGYFCPTCARIVFDTHVIDGIRYCECMTPVEDIWEEWEDV